MATGDKPTVYLETSIPSYYVGKPSPDPIVLGHQIATQLWWQDAADRYRLFVSEVVRDEASDGDPDAATARLAAIADLPMLLLSSEASNVADVYLERLPLPRKAYSDALHIALALVNEIDYLVTWNLRHIALGSVKRALPRINAALGYASPTICTPEELLHEGSSEVD